MYKSVLHFIATWGYLGRIPYAPGTAGTFGAIPLVLVLIMAGPIFYMIGAWLVTLVAIIICVAYEKSFEVHDPKEIVIDEVAGFSIAMTWLPATWQAFVAAFVVFRLLDGLKPFPLNWLDRNVKGGVGVVADDVAAGILTNIILQVIYVSSSWLGTKFVV